MRRKYNQFSHANNARYDSRLIALRSRHGWLGYGLYWALLELLNTADEAILVADYCALSYELRVDEATLQSVIEDFDLFDFTQSAAGDTLFSSNTLTEQRAEARRISEIRAAAGRCRGVQSKANAKQMLSKSKANAKQMLSKSKANAKQMLSKSKANAKQMLSKSKANAKQMVVSTVIDSSSSLYEGREEQNIDKKAENVENTAKNQNSPTLHVNVNQANIRVKKEKEEKKESIKERKEQREKVVVEKAPRFCPPTVDEVKAYCLEKNYTVDAENFCDFYESKGWFVGKNKMKSWQAAVRTWQRRPNHGAARTMAARSVTALDTSSANYSETF